MAGLPPSSAPSAKALRQAKGLQLRRRLAAFGLLAAGLGVVLAVASVVGVRQGWMSYRLGEGLVFALLSPGFAILGAALGLLTLAFAAAVQPRRGFKRGGIALLLGVVTAGAVAALSATPKDAPPVHEVATDWREPLTPSPGLVALRGPSANPIEQAPAVSEGPVQGGFLGRLVAEVNAKTCPAAMPATVLGGPDAAYAKAKAALANQGLVVVTDAPTEGRLEAVAVRGLFAQKDDVIVRIRSEGAGSRIDFRSIARDDASDGGVNCARLTKLRAAVAN